LEGVKGGEMLMAALDLVEAELPRFKAEEGAAGAPGRQVQYRNPLLLGLSPHAYMLRALRSVKAPDLEHALLVLPFHYVARLIGMLIALMRRGLDVELCTKCAVHLLRCHQAQILHTHYLLEEMLALKELIASSIHSYRTLVGVNMTGLRAMKTVGTGSRRFSGEWWSDGKTGGRKVVNKRR
jgi:U3 small nucleolar RNA-associated protein 12